MPANDSPTLGDKVDRRNDTPPWGWPMTALVIASTAWIAGVAGHSPETFSSVYLSPWFHGLAIAGAIAYERWSQVHRQRAAEHSGSDEAKPRDARA
jgi:cytosine/uracil/thiamine/allantoin permease